MPRYDDDDDDRPRRSKKKRKPAAPSWPKWVAGGVAFVVCFAIAFFLVKGLGGKSKTGGGDNVGAPAPAGVKYVPHESEEKFSAFLKTRPDHTTITEAEVFAIMGEPTRREHVFTGTRNGMHMTVYEAFWEVPDSGVQSSIGFMNGKCSGMVIGLKTK